MRGLLGLALGLTIGFYAGEKIAKRSPTAKLVVAGPCDKIVVIEADGEIWAANVTDLPRSFND